MKFRKTEAGRYYAQTDDFAYVVRKADASWQLLIYRMEDVPGLSFRVQSDRAESVDFHDTLGLAKKTADAFERDAHRADWSYMNRITRAVTESYAD